MIHVTFTCKDRPALTELCLRRLVELMPPPYDLTICYDGYDPDYVTMLEKITPSRIRIIRNYGNVTKSRFSLINKALEDTDAEYYMHVENDFYWVDSSCLDTAINAFYLHGDLDYIRFELLPFTEKNFNRYEKVDGKDVCWMREDSPYRFTFNPHIRRFKYPTGRPFKENGFTKQPEQHHNDGYQHLSACMTGDNWRHLGVYSEGGHYKGYYGERFFNQRGRRDASKEEYIQGFNQVTSNSHYRKLFRRYINDNMDIRTI